MTGSQYTGTKTSRELDLNTAFSHHPDDHPAYQVYSRYEMSQQTNITFRVSGDE